MPILRYFLFVGGTLLALLVLADAVLPSVPLPASLSSASDLPPVRIQSTRKWPERIVMDTSIATPAPVKLAKAEQPPAEPAGEVAKNGLRDAFAQMSAVEANRQVAAVKAAEKPRAMRIADTSKAKKRKVARAHLGRPMILVAQQPHVGPFAWTW
ncbi:MULTISPECIES: hypothetical protein [unclassified Bradyrhizobium]|uniref:hypothetical protein n=1 Tax=unclassified Bradyrhizobium TaxID=2631580 RepID=UPI0028E5B255|nr:MULTISPECIES: hypothetical protein [unclassified Bradyrhizobium]